MFTTSKIIGLFSNVKDNPDHSNPETSLLSELVKHVKIESGMEETSMSYFCKVSVLELSKSDISDDVVYQMLDNGWVLTKDRKFLKKTY